MPPWLLKQPAGSGSPRTESARGKKALAIFAEVGKARCRQTNEFSRFAGNAGPPLWRAFALWVGLSRGLASMEPCTRRIARAAARLPCGTIEAQLGAASAFPGLLMRSGWPSH
jgi:hypothetical protein